MNRYVELISDLDDDSPFGKALVRTDLILGFSPIICDDQSILSLHVNVDKLSFPFAYYGKIPITKIPLTFEVCRKALDSLSYCIDPTSKSLFNKFYLRNNLSEEEQSAIMQELLYIADPVSHPLQASRLKSLLPQRLFFDPKTVPEIILKHYKEGIQLVKDNTPLSANEMERKIKQLSKEFEALL